MYREMRLKQRAVNHDKAVKIIINGSYGVLSTTGDDGYPYGVPLNYTYFGNCICFHCSQKGHKLENIDFNEKVSFCVVTRSDVIAKQFDTDYESAVAFGTASRVVDNSEKKEILISLINKYSPDHFNAGINYLEKYWDETSVIKIKIEHLSGKAHE